MDLPGEDRTRQDTRIAIMVAYIYIERENEGTAKRDQQENPVRKLIVLR